MSVSPVGYAPPPLRHDTSPPERPDPKPAKPPDHPDAKRFTPPHKQAKHKVDIKA